MTQSLHPDRDESTPPQAAAAGDAASGPFGDAAPGLLAHGLAVLPCAGEDGKVPLVRWRGWKVTVA